MHVPRIRPQQAASINSMQTGVQQTSSIDISTLMNLMVPAMMVGMMGKTMSDTQGKSKQVKSSENETINP